MYMIDCDKSRNRPFSKAEQLALKRWHMRTPFGEFVDLREAVDEVTERCETLIAMFNKRGLHPDLVRKLVVVQEAVDGLIRIHDGGGDDSAA